MVNSFHVAPETGTFLSVDPVVANISDPQQHNAYAYARNNPVNATDPTGRNCVSIFGCGMITTGGSWVTAAQTTTTTTSIYWTNQATGEKVGGPWYTEVAVNGQYVGTFVGGMSARAAAQVFSQAMGGSAGLFGSFGSTSQGSGHDSSGNGNGGYSPNSKSFVPAGWTFREMKEAAGLRTNPKGLSLGWFLGVTAVANTGFDQSAGFGIEFDPASSNLADGFIYSAKAVGENQVAGIEFGGDVGVFLVRGSSADFAASTLISVSVGRFSLEAFFAPNGTPIGGSFAAGPGIGLSYQAPAATVWSTSTR